MKRASRKSSSRPFGPRPAPGDLRMVQDFVNSRRIETGEDELPGPLELAVWLSERDLLPAGSRLEVDDWQAALAIREGLRALIAAHGGAELDRRVVENLNRAVTAARPRFSFAADGDLRLQSVASGWPAALDRLLIAVLEAIAEGDWRRLKTCHSETCQLVFYDASRNLAGKWCSTRRCGNRQNTATYRRRGPRWRRGPKTRRR